MKIWLSGIVLEQVGAAGRKPVCVIGGPKCLCKKAGRMWWRRRGGGCRDGSDLRLRLTRRGRVSAYGRSQPLTSTRQKAATERGFLISVLVLFPPASQ